MAIDSPTTYGDHWWAKKVEADLAVQEKFEQELAPTVSGIISGLNIHEFLPPSLAPLFANLEAPTDPAFGAIMGRFGSEVADGVVTQGLNHALKDFNYKMAEWFSDLRIDKGTASILWNRKKITEEMYDSRMASEGFKPAEAAAYYESLRAFPSIPDFMTWARYHGDYDNVKAAVWERMDVSEEDFDVWEWLTEQKLTTPQVQQLLKRGKYDQQDAHAELGRIGWHAVDRDMVLDLGYLLPNAMLQVQGGLIQGLEHEQLLSDISRSDIHPDYAQRYLDAVLTKPASEDIVAYQLRRDPGLSDLDRELQRVGIHPDYTNVYRELAQQIPPVADIITMAVREAFTPDIAARFGQYEDFPDELAEWGAKKGLSKEWTQRYWAAHWSLPSPQQGFEMLHRGVIDAQQLGLLLRASDVMPFWRDKLVEIAYNPLTRVDVRRMYKLGVLNESEVYESYLIAGYDEQNARRMSDFTVRQTLNSLAKFSTNDIVKAFTKRMISRGEAAQLLSVLDVRSEDAQYILTTAEYKRHWAFTEQQIKGIRNLYKKRVLDDNQAHSKLAQLNLPAEQIDVLMKQWYYEVKDEDRPTWTPSQSLSFAKKGLITEERARQELHVIGYDQEHIDVMMRSIV